MQSKIKVALLSFWHVHAIDYAKQALEHPDIELVAIWDEDVTRGKQAAAQLSVSFIEALDDILEDESIDGVIITSATTSHQQLMLAAARNKKHIFTEKVVACTSNELNTIFAAVDQEHIVFTTSLPRLSMAFLQGMKQLLPQLGELTYVRARLSHHGALPSNEAPNGYLPQQFFSLAEAGGGALLDLGCHPMIIVRELLGMPDELSSYFSYITGKEVEDQAVVMLKYDDGKLGVVEASFVNQSSPFVLEVHAQQGSARFNAYDGKLQYRLAAHKAKEWTEFQLPSPLATPFEQWVLQIQKNEKHIYNEQRAKDLTILMEAAILSHKERCSVKLDKI